MEKNHKSCNFLYSEVMSGSVPNESRFVGYIKKITGPRLGPYLTIHKNIFRRKKNFKEQESLNLQQGDWVEVRSIDEISLTLDNKGQYKGLYFMPEMQRCCGKKFKVFKIAKTIKLESTGEVRKFRTPSVFLEGVYCDHSELHDGCERSCFHFWKEAWLKRSGDN